MSQAPGRPPDDAGPGTLTSTNILMVEDDPLVLDYVRTVLESAGATAQAATTADGGFAEASTGRYDAIVLDVNLPGGSGFDVARRLRAAGVWTPILLLTARNTEEDVVQGLDAGADDYVSKPVAPGVLLARLRAIVRRSTHAGEGAPPRGAGRLSFADVEMDRLARTVERGGVPIHLTPTEFKILETLMLRPRLPVSRELLLSEVWGMDFEPGTTNLAVHVSHLRAKLEHGGGARLIFSVRPGGFTLSD